MEQLNYVIEDKIIAELLGETNFSTKEAAVLELVKNAYDARATELVISIEKDKLVLKDNGTGMNDEDIRRSWMHVGSSDKAYSVGEGDEFRVLAGSKGVGRFALAKLGRRVKVFTRKTGFDGVVWSTEWDGSYLDVDSSIAEIGTCLEICDTRDTWEYGDVNRLRNFLSRAYNDERMRIVIRFGGEAFDVLPCFDVPRLGYNCVSKINVSYDCNDARLSVFVESDEFAENVAELVSPVDIHRFSESTDLALEKKTISTNNVQDDEFAELLKRVGSFTAEFYFSPKTVSTRDRETYQYKYGKLDSRYDEGVVLYRNAFSINSFDGSTDWLGIDSRMRKSPAGPGHKTGSWRVRFVQLSGKVIIDKQENANLKELANRQGMENDAVFETFVGILHVAIGSFERYRQSVMRPLRRLYDEEIEKAASNFPISEAIEKGKQAVEKLLKDDQERLTSELREKGRLEKAVKAQYDQREQDYKYDIRILNVLATSGLKASAQAHELKNSQSDLMMNFTYIEEALKRYGLWDELCTPERSRLKIGDVPRLLNETQRANEKVSRFISFLLEDVEKDRFRAKSCNLFETLRKLVDRWKSGFSMLEVSITNSQAEIVLAMPPDALQVIVDNLVLNTLQQNARASDLLVVFDVEDTGDFCRIAYSDNGVGLAEKYRDNPLKILEVHETSRPNGHGLGMWIVNNTLSQYGGSVESIGSEAGFRITMSMRKG